jgi:MFS family permease
MNDKKSDHTEEELSLANQQKFWTREFVLIALINMGIFFGFNMTTIGIPIYVAQLGATDLIAGLVTTFATGAALFVRPFSGIMSDRFGRKGILVSGVAAMTAIIAAYAVFPILSVIVGLRLLHGIGWGLGSTAISTMAADTIPKKRFAEGMGYFALAASLAAAVAPALSVALIQNAGIKPMIIVAASCTAGSLILSVFQLWLRPNGGLGGGVQSYPKIAKREQKKKWQMCDLFEKKALLPASMIFLLNCAFASIVTFITLHGQAKGIDTI